ncbi:hypothetical protein GCM10009777_39890 [Microbacterium pumilum]|uniref:Transposase n=1 Tax=Microbacterium pumilum TaxID=344165 RepID=A0ABP5EID6_9MICO
MTHIMFGRIEVARVDEHCWRLCDATLPEDDPRRVIALAELKDEHVTVLWLRERNSRSTFATFEQALGAAEKIAYKADRRRASRPVPIPHFPPRRHALGSLQSDSNRT